jgi:CRISPR/Cas system CMR-associated protein Cmr5 small subunit
MQIIKPMEQVYIIKKINTEKNKTEQLDTVYSSYSEARRKVQQMVAMRNRNTEISSMRYKSENISDFMLKEITPDVFANKIESIAIEMLKVSTIPDKNRISIKNSVRKRPNTFMREIQIGKLKCSA